MDRVIDVVVAAAELEEVGDPVHAVEPQCAAEVERLDPLDELLEDGPLGRITLPMRPLIALRSDSSSKPLVSSPPQL